jgi:hypothetical protein
MDDINGDRLLALARSRLLAGLLVAAGAEGEGSHREGDDRCNFGDGHGIFRLLSLQVALRAT